MGIDIPWDEFDWKDKIKTTIKIPYLIYVYLRLRSIADNMDQQDIIANAIISYYKLPAPMKKCIKKRLLILEEKAEVNT